MRAIKELNRKNGKYFLREEIKKAENNFSAFFIINLV